MTEQNSQGSFLDNDSNINADVIDIDHYTVAIEDTVEASDEVATKDEQTVSDNETTDEDATEDEQTVSDNESNESQDAEYGIMIGITLLLYENINLKNKNFNYANELIKPLNIKCASWNLYKNKVKEYDNALNETRSLLTSAKNDHAEHIFKLKKEYDDLKKKYSLEESESYFSFLKNTNNVVLIKKKSKDINQKIKDVGAKYCTYSNTLQHYPELDDNNDDYECEKYMGENMHDVHLRMTCILNYLSVITEESEGNETYYMDRREIDIAIQLLRYESTIEIKQDYLLNIYYKNAINMIESQTIIKFFHVIGFELHMRFQILFMLFELELGQQLNIIYVNCKYGLFTFYLTTFIMYNFVQIIHDKQQTKKLIIPTFSIEYLNPFYLISNNIIVNDIVLIVDRLKPSNLFTFNTLICATAFSTTFKICNLLTNNCILSSIMVSHTICIILCKLFKK